MFGLVCWVSLKIALWFDHVVIFLGSSSKDLLRVTRCSYIRTTTWLHSLKHDLNKSCPGIHSNIHFMLMCQHTGWYVRCKRREGIIFLLPSFLHSFLLEQKGSSAQSFSKCFSWNSELFPIKSCLFLAYIIIHCLTNEGFQFKNGSMTWI